MAWTDTDIQKKGHTKKDTARIATAVPLEFLN